MTAIYCSTKPAKLLGFRLAVWVACLPLRDSEAFFMRLSWAPHCRLTTGFSFFYADQVGFTGSVSVYSGPSGTGTLLASLTLPSTPDPYTVFVPVGVTFPGTADSVVFSGAVNFIAFDNITLGSGKPTVSEPSSMELLGTGLIGLGLLRARRKI